MNELVNNSWEKIKARLLQDERNIFLSEYDQDDCASIMWPVLVISEWISQEMGTIPGDFNLLVIGSHRTFESSDGMPFTLLHSLLSMPEDACIHIDIVDPHLDSSLLESVCSEKSSKPQPKKPQKSLVLNWKKLQLSDYIRESKCKFDLVLIPELSYHVGISSSIIQDGTLQEILAWDVPVIGVTPDLVSSYVYLKALHARGYGGNPRIISFPICRFINEQTTPFAGYICKLPSKCRKLGTINDERALKQVEILQQYTSVCVSERSRRRGDQLGIEIPFKRDSESLSLRMLPYDYFVDNYGRVYALLDERGSLVEIKELKVDSNMIPSQKQQMCCYERMDWATRTALDAGITEDKIHLLINHDQKSAVI